LQLPDLTPSSSPTRHWTTTTETDSPTSLFSSPLQSNACSNTDLDSNDTGSEGDPTDQDTGVGPTQYALSPEESRVLLALGNDWDLTACWFTKTRSGVYPEFSTEICSRPERVIRRHTRGSTIHHQHGSPGDRPNLNEATNPLSSDETVQETDSLQRGRSPDKPSCRTRARKI
jgi:hypothetical protein